MQVSLEQWCEIQVLTVITWTHRSTESATCKAEYKTECKIHEGEDLCFTPSCIPSAHSWLSINTSEMNERPSLRIVRSIIFLNIIVGDTAAWLMGQCLLINILTSLLDGSQQYLLLVLPSRALSSHPVSGWVHVAHRIRCKQTCVPSEMRR